MPSTRFLGRSRDGLYNSMCYSRKYPYFQPPRATVMTIVLYALFEPFPTLLEIPVELHILL